MTARGSGPGGTTPGCPYCSHGATPDEERPCDSCAMGDAPAERDLCPCGEVRDDFGACAKCDAPEQPEPPAHVTATCRFCGTEFEAGPVRAVRLRLARLADDCGGCRLNDAQCEEYARDLAAKYGYPKGGGR